MAQYRRLARLGPGVCGWLSFDTDAIIKVDVNQSRATFGQIVGAYQGNIDSYTKTLQFLADLPICPATASLFDTSFFDDPICGQLDLDFGASPNLFTVNGVQVVGDLQKAGVYHAATTSTMKLKWSKIVGTPCVICNASATAKAGGHIFGEGTLGGFAFRLNESNGAFGWYTPVADAVHYQSFSYANGVASTVDTLGFLDAFSAANGLPLARRLLLADSGQVVVSLSSTGVSVARHRVFVGVGSLVEPGTPLPQNGYLVAFKAP